MSRRRRKREKEEGEEVKKAKKSKKNRPAPPGVPSAGGRARVCKHSGNGSKLSHDKFDSDSDVGAPSNERTAARTGESKQASGGEGYRDERGEGKSGSSPGVSGPTANLVREDSNWLDDDFDDDDDEEEGKVSTSNATSPRSKKAGVAVDQSCQLRLGRVTGCRVFG